MTHLEQSMATHKELVAKYANKWPNRKRWRVEGSRGGNSRLLMHHTAQAARASSRRGSSGLRRFFFFFLFLTR